MSADRRGKFVTFEGIEGSGKTTQLERLAARLGRAGCAAGVTLTREPGGTELGRVLRSLLLRPCSTPMPALAELLLYATDRVQHLTEVVEPALARGGLVLCDRYLDATLAYQGYGRGLGMQPILELHRHPPLDRRPDRTILLDLDPDTSLARAIERNRAAGLAESEGRFEAERMDFHRRVRQGYLALAAGEPERMRVVDAAGDARTVEQRVLRELDGLLPAEATA